MTPTQAPVSILSPKVTRADQLWMRYAIEIAQVAAERGMMPFGCVIVNEQGRELATAGGTGSELDPTAHSEMLAIRHACTSWGLGCPEFLRGCALYSTHSPCLMCAAASNHAKLSRVVFGSDRGDLPHLFRPQPLSSRLWSQTSHPPIVLGGVCRAECVALLAGVEKWD